METYYVPIDRFVVALGCYDLGRKVVWCPAKCPGVIWHLLGKTEICNFQVAMSI